MGIKSEEMKELMGRLSKHDPEIKTDSSRKDSIYDPLPLEILLNAKQDKIHQEFPKKRTVVKRIRIRQSE